MIANVTIRMKLFLSFGFLTLSVLFLGILGVQGAATINAMLVETQSRDLPKTQAVGEINDWAGRYTISLFRYILNGSEPQAAQTIEEEMQQRTKEIAKLSQRYESFAKSPEEEKVFVSFKKNWAAYLESVPPMLELARGGNIEQARRMVDTVVTPHRKRALSDAKQLYVFAKDSAAAAGMRAAETYAWTREVVVAACAAGTLVSLALATLIVWSIGRSCAGIIKPMQALERFRAALNRAGGVHAKLLG